MRRVAVIGGGVAGCSAALSLAQRRVPALILEREPWLGGLSAKLACKGADACVRCDACLARERPGETRAYASIERAKMAELLSLGGGPGDFRLTYQTPQGRRTARAGAVICATGAEPYDAALDRRLGHGEVHGVLTNLELELLLSKGPLRVPSTGRPPQSVAFVQCVGSRDVGSSPYCSGYCCKSTYKEAQAIRAQAPSCKISLFYMDWRLFDPRENVRAWASGQEGVELLPSRPAQVTPAGDGRPEVRFASEGDATVESRAFDLVVLALGLRPAPGSAQLASRLGIELDAAGFMRGLPHDPCASTRPGVFLAGSCRQPGDILACAQEGATAATRALALLEGRR